MSRPRVALATCEAYPDLDDDDRLVLPELAARGIDAVPAVWDEPGVDWAGFDLAVIRSTWDYPLRHDAFLDWARRVDAACGLANPAAVVAWNTDKRYLADLAAAGVPTTPTTVLEPGGDPWDPPADGEYVVKPATSAGSRDTARYRAGADDAVARTHVAGLLAAGRPVLVQPYLDAVDTDGETALLYIAGDYSHAIRKGPLLRPGAAPTDELFAPEEIRPRTPTAAQRAVADAVLAALPAGPDPLYARVDLIETSDGPVLLEVELTEPSLFMAHDEGAPARLAEAIAARVS